MVKLVKGATLAEGPALLMTGLRDPLLLTQENGETLYVTSAARGGLLALDPASLAIKDQRDFQMAQSGLGAERHLVQVGARALIASGQQNSGLELFTLDEEGRFSGAKILRASGLPGAIETITPFTLGGDSFLLLSSRLKPNVGLWKFDEAKGLSAVKSDLFPQDEALAPDQMLALPMGDKALLLTLSAGSNRLASHWLSKDGSLSPISSLGTPEGLYTSGLNSIEEITIGGQIYLLLGASGSSSIVVAALGHEGELRLTDHVIDDLNSRFGRLQALATVQAGEQPYVIAAGTDLGISLFTLLPEGKLVLVDVLAGGGASAMNNVSGLEARWTGRSIEVFVTGTSAAGISGAAVTKIDYPLGPEPKLHRLGKDARFSAGAGNDILVATAGASRIEGGDGDDILVDGAGPDTLVGGAGSDLFVLRPDAFDDVILDFNPAQDWLDLSQLGSYYTLAAMGFQSTAKGAELNMGGQKILLYSHDGNPITAKDLSPERLRGPSHVSLDPWADEEPPSEPPEPQPPVEPPVAPPAEPPVEPPVIPPVAPVIPPPTQPVGPPEPSDPQFLMGSELADVLRGGSGNDTLIGQGGADRLFGSGGDDLLFGASLHEGPEQSLAQVYRLYQAALNRIPDEGGLISWNHLVSSGKKSLTQVATGFIKSTEFLSNYGDTSNGDYITLLYNNVLGRDPDEGGYDNWLRQMEIGGMSREAVLLGFSDSVENVERTKIGAMTFGLEGLQAHALPQAFRFYVATLNRVPDLEGLLSWSKLLAQGRDATEIANGFINSVEFQERYGAAAGSEFITLVYRNILGREPDQGGLESWTNFFLNTSRNQVVIEMMKEQEFLSKSAPVMKDWMKSLGVDDYLAGGGGENHLYGGLYRDHFVFSAQERSANTVYRLEPWDLVEMEGFGYLDSSDLFSHLSYTDKGTVFADAGVSILFANLYPHEVLAADFLFYA